MFRFIQIVLSAIVVLSGSTVTASDTKSYTALKFAYDRNSMVSYSPDMTPLTDKFTICAWVRKLVSGHGLAPFGYEDYEIFMTDSGYYIRLFGSYSLDGALTRKFTSPVGTWFMYCSTWSLASRTFRVYVNGQLAGTETTPSGRKLQTGGALTFGALAPNRGHHFGGELFNFNVYEKELTATEVAAMSSGGLCTEIPEQLEEYRVIKWENIVKLSRSGTVQDLETRCDPVFELRRVRGKLELAVSEKNTLQLSLNRTQTELLEVQGLFNSTQEALVGVKRDLGVIGGELNDTKVELVGVKRELGGELNETRRELVGVRLELGEMGGELNETKSQLEDTQLELADTKLELKNVTESKCELQKGNLTKWDMFYAPAYYNKIFTRRLYKQLTRTWASIRRKIFKTV